MDNKKDPSNNREFGGICSKCHNPYVPEFLHKTDNGLVCNNCEPLCKDCNQHKPVTDGKQTDKGFVCNDCSKKKRNRILIACAILIACVIAGLVIWKMIVNSEEERRIASGFEGITEINDSINVKVDAPKIEFNLATATLTSMPVAAQAPVDNIEEFKRILAKNVKVAEQNNSQSLALPVVAIMFNFNSSEISKAGEDLLKEISKVYNESSKQGKVIVDGYACNIGDEETNNYISQLRAENVKNELIKDGIPIENIEINWYGKSKNSQFSLTKNEDYRRVLINFKD